MRLIDADELREKLYADKRGYSIHLLDAAPTVDVPQPLTRDGVLAEVARIEAAGDAAVVEVMWTTDGEWGAMCVDWIDRWPNPDVPRWNVRVRAVEVETEDVPLTQLVGRTIKGETLPIVAVLQGENGVRCANVTETYRPFPDGTLDLAIGEGHRAQGGSVMDAPDLREMVARAINSADNEWADARAVAVGAWPQHVADAVLAVPAIADALRAAELLAKVREIMDERITGFAGSDDAVHEITELLESATP